MANWLRGVPTPRITTDPRPTRLGVESLELREVPASLAPDNLSGALHPERPDRAAVEVIYTESNNPAPGQNAVLGFYRNPVTGGLVQFGTFATGGTGQLNIPKIVGPDDGDQEVQATADGRFLFAVNQGSGSVTAFRIRGDGALDRIGAFASGGVQPDSIGIAGNHLYVANRGDAAAGVPGTVAPNVAAFTIDRDGSLTLVPNSTVTFPVGTFVTQTLITNDRRFLFAEVASLEGAAQGNTLTPFEIEPDGTLQPAPGGSVAAGPNTRLILGAAAHPYLNIVYSGLTAAGQVGVFTYDETGRTSFVGASADQGRAPCWSVVSADGRFLYVANTATNSVGVYSLADPLHPVQIQDLVLGGPRAAQGATAAFQLAIDPTGRSLYVIGQSTDPAVQQGNQLHTLTIARDGTLTERTGPVLFAPGAVPGNAHPQGIAVVALHGRPHHDFFFGPYVDDRWVGHARGRD